MSLFYKMKNHYHRTVLGLKSLFSWLPVVWKDRNWDYSYMYIILHKKILDMEKYFGLDKVDLEVIIELRTVREALERLIDDEHHYIEACNFYEVFPHEYHNEFYRNHAHLIRQRVSEKIKEDQEIVFSSKVSSKIQEWLV